MAGFLLSHWVPPCHQTDLAIVRIMFLGVIMVCLEVEIIPFQFWVSPPRQLPVHAPLAGVEVGPIYMNELIENMQK